MIIEQNTFEDGSSFALWEVTETVDELLEQLDNDPFIIEQISAFTSQKRKLEFLSARCALNQLLGRKCTIAYHPTGRPFIEGSDMNISISHTGQWVTVLTHPSKRIGIDIERITDRLIRVKNKFLSEQELRFVDFQCEKPQLAIMWATKESLYKLLDVKGLDALEELHIEPFMTYLDGRLTAYESHTDVKEHFEVEYLVRPQYVITRIVEQ